jgi:heat shock protein HslJ
MDTNPNDMNSEDQNFDDAKSSNPDPSENSGNMNSSEKNSNLAITIVVVVGILLGAVMLFSAPSEDMVSSTPGPGTPQISQPIATPPTPQIQPTQPAQDRPTTLPPNQVQPTAPSVPANPIQGINWQWDSLTDNSTGQTTGVPIPAQYTIAFNSDGTVNGLADCNSFTGKYSLTNGVNIRITTMTMAACPDGSLDQQYIELLNNVAAGGPDGSGNLALETAGGAQRMLFMNGGPAQ